MEEVIADKEIQYDDEPDHSEVDNEEGRIDNSDTEQHISSGESDTEIIKNKVFSLGKNKSMFHQ